MQGKSQKGKGTLKKWEHLFYGFLEFACSEEVCKSN